MKLRLRIFFLASTGAVFALIASTSAQRIEWMKQLAPDTGWVATSQRLFWTTNGGHAWKDITPPQLNEGREISAAFFLDNSRGWVVMSSYYDSANTTRYFLASTDDAGTNWSLRRVVIPSLYEKDSTPLTNSVSLQFTDALHGIITLGATSSLTVHSAAFAVTSDGGKTWQMTASATKGTLLFTTQNDGWVATADGVELSVTHDGAKSWQDVVLPGPAKPGKANATYHLPIFPDREHGFLSVDYSGPKVHLVVLFSSLDGGRTWKPDQVLPASEHTYFAVLNSEWRTLTLADHKLIFASPSASSPPSSAFVDAAISTLDTVSFLDGLHGWALVGVGDQCDETITGCVQLLSTLDSGASWTNITPAEIKGKIVGALPGIRTGPLTWKRPNQTSQSAPSDVSRHLGIDISYVLPTSSMQTWWNTSQYWDTNVYLPGSANRGVDSNLNTAWIAAIQTQGWGIIPTWFGAQPSTACLTGSTPGNCTKYFTITINPANANAQGVAEATAAINSAQSLNTCCIVIYKNIENYVTATDGTAVRAFLSGWATQLHNSGYQAAVYGNPGPAATDFSKVTPALDDAWLAKSNKQVSTWGIWTLGGTSDTTLWPTNQRIHQYWIDHSETHGGVKVALVDSDIEDATIISNNGVKPYSWLWTIVISPYVQSGYSSLMFADINNSDRLVGEYWSGGHLYSGALYDGASGTITNINGPGTANPVTEIFAVNNLGDMFGDTYGYWKYHAGNFAQFNLPAGYVFSDRPWGLNDAGQMSGDLKGPCGICHFLYEAGKYSYLSYPGSAYTYAGGLNGQGQTVGYYESMDGSLHGFVYSVADGWATLDYPGAPNTLLRRINNSGGILGEANYGTSQSYFLYYNGGFTVLPLPQFTYEVGATGLNDFADIAGWGQNTGNNGYPIEGTFGQTQH